MGQAEPRGESGGKGMGSSPTLSQVNIQAPCLSFVSPWRQMSHPTGEPSKLHLCCCGSHFFMPFTATLHLFNYYSSGVALLTSLAVGSFSILPPVEAVTLVLQDLFFLSQAATYPLLLKYQRHLHMFRSTPGPSRRRDEISPLA